jgi:hypothetical protein
MAQSSPLPAGFLSGPAPNLTRSDIDFVQGGLPAYKECWAVVLDGVLSEAECDMLLAGAEATTNGVWERAMINIGGGQQALYEEERKCGRIIWDDRDIAAKLWARVEAAVPEIHSLKAWPKVTGNGPYKWEETWQVTRLNERLRFLKYVGGEYFKGASHKSVLRYILTRPAHCDGAYETPDRMERSYFTLHLYLNDAEGKDGQAPLEGGATTFHSFSYNNDRRLDVVPKCGRVLLFQHRDLLHAGDDVINGTKYTLRTDIMYELVDGKPRPKK